MALSEEEVRHVAMLARLQLTDEEVESLRTDLNSILDYVDQLQKLELADVDPMEHPIPTVNVTRPDEPRPVLSREDALRNAPESQDGAFVIPRIVGGGDAS
ncbi:MAG: Asp-tRNA(Asn)/Glu-tRNA(Gln) amidotransferase subunit GatC [Coriobacteriales bacterium]|nr:Asp-tRNA(Asn)/Glu-tRNA(Gln) amidotransferase subunit GatC [Coriobacteriales bacterium]